MENSFQTSFIPKKPVTTVIKARTSKIGFASIFSIFLLVVTGALSGGLFLYKTSLISQEDVLSASLSQASKDFNKDTIAQLQLYTERMKTAKPILDNHVALSPLFALIGQLTIPTIQYTRFEHKTDDHGYTVTMSGVASDYKGIALQADAFNSPQGNALKNVVFSNLIKDPKGNVAFDLNFTVDPSLLSYEKNNALNPNPNPNPNPASSQTPSSPTSDPTATQSAASDTNASATAVSDTGTSAADGTTSTTPNTTN